MKKIFGLIAILLCLGLGSYSYAVIPSTCTTKRFRVTSYYSPLPDQAFYNMNSYEEEKIMNGNGTNGASWRAVFNGMIAAPKSYGFGTQIVFPWRWIGQVEDRWGWIVEEWERWQQFDRIDFWVGKWHEGLRRALSFGVQYIDWYICPSGTYSESKIGFDYDRFPYYSDFFERMIRIISMRPGRDDLMVKSLQYFLVQLWYLEPVDTTWFYGPRTTAAVCQLQQDTLWLPSNHQSCGQYGPQTRRVLANKIKNSWRTLKGIREQFASSEEIVVTQTHADELTVSAPVAVTEPRGLPLDWIFGHGGEFESYIFSRPLVFWESSKTVRILQRKLQRLGHYDDKIDISWTYDTYTIQALYKLQLESWLLDGTEDHGVRGYFGPGTRGVINTL